MVKNNARLLAQGDNMEKGIVFDETFEIIARLEIICAFTRLKMFLYI